MVNYRSPGVYIEEVEAGSRPIEGVGTAVAAFLGIAADGPFNTPSRIANWGQYVKEFGGWVEGAYMPLSVFNFFNNGGGAGQGSGGGGSGGRGGGDSAGGTFTVVVKQGGQPVESYQNLTTRRGKRNVATVINEESQLVKVEETGSASQAERLPSAGEVVLAGGGP